MHRCEVVFVSYYIFPGVNHRRREPAASKRNA